MPDEVQNSNEEPEAHQDLRHPREALSATPDARLAPRDELRSLVEALQASNEELERAREELERRNRALHAQNQRLEAENEALDGLIHGLNALVSSAQVTAILLDEELRIRRFTPAAARLMRLVESDIGRPIGDIKQRLDPQELATLARGVLESGQATERKVHSDDSTYYVQRILPHRSADGRIGGVCITYGDVTEAHPQPIHTDTARQLAHRHADLENERARKNEFLAMLGHELRNPLSALTYGLELLDAVTAPEKVEKTRQMMARQLHRMMVMLDQLLEMSRVTQGKIVLKCEALDLGAVVQSVIEVIVPHVEKRHQHLSTSLPEQGELIFRGDANRLAQVIENLLFNAVKYTDDGGHIEVKLEQIHGNAVISVSDTGMGIEAELMPSIFDLFVQSARTLQRSEGGFGLGLPLARELVELHGGELSAYSAGTGKGSTFTATLPMNAESTPTKRAPENDASVDTGSTQRGATEAPRILVIDDEADLAALFMRLLQRKGFTVKMATDGAEGIEIARRFRPRVILLDLGLPGLDGYAVARRLRQEFSPSELLLIAVSGYERNDAKLQSAGFDRHLLKPPDMAVLEEWIRALD